MQPAAIGTPMCLTSEELQKVMGLHASTSVRTRVLVVDEDKDQRQLLSIHFESTGCDITAVESAEAALVALDEAPFDLAVTELLLPGIDGWTLAERIGREYPDCETAICSVLDEESYPETSLALAKPVTRSQVRALLAEASERRRSSSVIDIHGPFSSVTHRYETHGRSVSA
jgi:CheY-like chemotaxis protein